MTFSIVGHDPEQGDWGIAVASKFPAVGSVVPWARAGVGAVATQSLANTDYGDRGLVLLGEGLAAEDVMARLTADDEGRAQRQVGMVDAAGRAATFTGGECITWAGGRTGPGWACQGNILTGPDVVDAMSEAYESTHGELADRLLAALAAGDVAGGDRRGRQSAALLVVRAGAGYGGRNDRYIDLRVDDHPAAPTELQRVFAVFDAEYLIRDDEVLEATPELTTELQRALIALDVLHGEPTGAFDEATRAALESFAGDRNLEGKVRADDRLFRSLVTEVLESAELTSPGTPDAG